jgi:PIN domain nuclease of toxin-antitoxin system
MTYVLDACALLAFLNDEPGTEAIEDLRECHNQISQPTHESHHHSGPL